MKWTTVSVGCTGVLVAATASCSLLRDDVACDFATPCPPPLSCGVDGFCHAPDGTPDAGDDGREGEGEGSVVVAEGEGEGEGSVVVAEGEGEGSVVVAEGEGEGEGSVVVAEGEGEGEGSVVVAEGEGEGAPPPPPPSPTCDATAVTGDYCGTDKVSNGARHTLYHCTGPGPATVIAACSSTCTIAPAGRNDYCAGATCSGSASTGRYCQGDKVSGGVANTLYECSGPGAAVGVRFCVNGCQVNAGTDDTCR